MNNAKEELLVVNENSVFYKIKTFFEKIFFHNKNKEIKQEVQEIKIPNSNNEKGQFIEKIKLKENKELEELLYLQKLFKMGKIKEKDLSKQERIELEKLYIYQNYELKKSINNYKNKIIAIRTKLVQND